jgi:iron complex transport system ATP-binding protein
VEPPFLELSDASVVVGGTRVLDALTLTIPVGRHTAILGPNGAGKSTFMKLLTLQLYPLPLARIGRGLGHEREAATAAETGSGDGPIRVFGRHRWDVFALRSRMGIVSADLHDRFVHGNSNGVLTGLDAVVSGFFATYGVFAHQRVTDEMRAQAAGALVRVEAGHLAGRTLDTLSTGEARRVLIARALVHHPEVLVLDEPTRGLDLVARHQFMERIRAVAREGTTLVLVTHYIDEIVPEIDRVVLLKRGRIVADGTKSEVLTPAKLGDAFGASLDVALDEGYYTVSIKKPV